MKRGPIAILAGLALARAAHAGGPSMQIGATEDAVRSASLSGAKAQLDLIVCADPANMDYLTGYKGWSFYVPQCVLVHADEEHPVWIGRGGRIAWLDEASMDRPVGRTHDVAVAREGMAAAQGGMAAARTTVP